MPQFGPPGGIAWQPSTSGNHLRWDGEAVVKNFGARLGAFARERAVLGWLATMPEALPVPRLLAAHRFGELRYAYIDGKTGGAAVESGLAPSVLTAMGTFLRQLHAVDSQPLTGVLPGEGPVLVHGDFAHYNVLVDHASGALLGVLDWEEARRGSIALDLAWCEWQFTNRFPELRWALKHLYDAYGDVPDQALRDTALRQRLDELRSRATVREEIQTDQPHDALQIHCSSFGSRAEAAAFVAALSRLLAGPVYRSFATEALVWVAGGGKSGTWQIYLSDAAFRATVSGFGAPPNAKLVEISRVPSACELLYGAGAIPAWGAADADRRLARHDSRTAT